MKAKILLVIILSFFSNILFSQKTILLYTNFPSSIKIIENDKLVNKTPIWTKNEGGYIIDINNDVKTLIFAKENINFKLSNDNSITKEINLGSGENLSIYKCLNSEEYCCERLTTKQQSATKKIYAVSLMKKNANSNKTVVFNELNHEFITQENVIIEWETDSVIKSISLYDVNSMEIVFEKELKENIYSINYNDIKIESKKELKSNNKYVLKITTRDLQELSTETKESSFEFKISILAFENRQYYYNTFESVKVNWKTKLDINSISIIEKKSGKVLSKVLNINTNELILSKVIEKARIISGIEYILNFETNNGVIIYYPFIILLDQDENEDLKMLLN
jgi:hypothetical protein